MESVKVGPSRLVRWTAGFFRAPWPVTGRASIKENVGLTVWPTGAYCTDRSPAEGDRPDQPGPPARCKLGALDRRHPAQSRPADREPVSPTPSSGKLLANRSGTSGGPLPVGPNIAGNPVRFGSTGTGRLTGSWQRTAQGSRDAWLATSWVEARRDEKQRPGLAGNQTPGWSRGWHALADRSGYPEWVGC